MQKPPIVYGRFLVWPALLNFAGIAILVFVPTEDKNLKLTVNKAVACILADVSRRTLNHWIRLGKIQITRAGNTIRIFYASLWRDSRMRRIPEKRMLKANRFRTVLTITSTCKLLKVSRRTVYYRLQSGKLKHIRTAGGAIRILRDSIKI